MRRAKRFSRVIASVDFYLTENDLTRIFLAHASRQDEHYNYSPGPPPTRECLRIIERTLWLYGINGIDTVTDQDPVHVRWAVACAARVYKSRLIQREQTE